MGKGQTNSIAAFNNMRRLLQQQDDALTKATNIKNIIEGTDGSGIAYNLGKLNGSIKQKFTPYRTEQRVNEDIKTLIRNFNKSLDREDYVLRPWISNLSSTLERKYSAIFNNKLLFDDQNIYSIIDKHVNWDKIPFNQFLNLRRKHANLALDDAKVVELDGKPVIANRTGYKSSFKEGPYKLTLFSDDPKVITLEGNLSSSSSGSSGYYYLNGKLYKPDSNSLLAKGQVPQEYINGQKSNSNYVIQRYGGDDNVISYGSSKLITDQGAPHVSGDQDFYITREALERYVKPEVSSGKSIFVSSDGPAGMENRYTIIMDGKKYGSNLTDHDHPARIDFNIIDNNVLTAADGRKESRAVQIFRQLFPKEYKAEVQRLKGDPQATMHIPFTNEQLFAKARENQDILSILDSLEASGANALQTGTPTYKHVGRWPELILGNNPQNMDKAIHQYARIQYGPNAQVPTFGLEYFQNEALNLDLLKRLDFPGNIELIAKSPEATRNAFNLMYVQNSGFTRNFNYAPTKEAWGISRKAGTYGPFAGTHEKSIYSGLTQVSPVTANPSNGTAGGFGLDVVSSGVSRPASYPGRLGVNGTGEYLRNGAFQPLRDMSKYKSPTELLDALDAELSGNMPITLQQIEGLNKLGYMIPIDGSIKTVKEALNSRYETGRGEYNQSVQEYINNTWPNLISRDVYDWSPSSTGWRNGYYGTGRYREVVKNLPEDQIAWTYGNNYMMSDEGTRLAVMHSGRSHWLADTYPLAQDNRGRNMYWFPSSWQESSFFTDSDPIFSPPQKFQDLVNSVAARKVKSLKEKQSNIFDAQITLPMGHSISDKYDSEYPSILGTLLNPFGISREIYRFSVDEGKSIGEALKSILNSKRDRNLAGKLIAIKVGLPTVSAGILQGIKDYDNQRKQIEIENKKILNLYDRLQEEGQQLQEAYRQKNNDKVSKEKEYKEARKQLMIKYFKAVADIDPEYYSEEDQKKLLNEYVNQYPAYKALGGPINTDNPIPNFAQNTHQQLPEVRYDLGGTLFAHGGDTKEDIRNTIAQQWPAANNIQYDLKEAPDLVQYKDNNGNAYGTIETIVPNQIAAQYSPYYNQVYGQPFDQWKYMEEPNRVDYRDYVDGQPIGLPIEGVNYLTTDNPGMNTVVYNPNYTTTEDIKQDLLHVMHDDPTYENLYNAYYTEAINDPKFLYHDINEGDKESIQNMLEGNYSNDMNGILKAADAENMLKAQLDGYLRDQYYSGTVWERQNAHYAGTPFNTTYNPGLTDSINNIKNYLETGRKDNGGVIYKPFKKSKYIGLKHI